MGQRAQATGLGATTESPSTSVKNDLIDLDLISGSAYTMKSKCQQGWLVSCVQTIVHVALLPLHLKWWSSRTTPRVAALLLVLYCAQLISLQLYYHQQSWTTPGASGKNSSNNRSGSGGNDKFSAVPTAEVLMPLAMMFVLGVVHTQIVGAARSVSSSSMTKAAAATASSSAASAAAAAATTTSSSTSTTAAAAASVSASSKPPSRNGRHHGGRHRRTSGTSSSSSTTHDHEEVEEEEEDDDEEPMLMDVDDHCGGGGGHHNAPSEVDVACSEVEILSLEQHTECSSSPQSSNSSSSLSSPTNRKRSFTTGGTSAAAAAAAVATLESLSRKSSATHRHRRRVFSDSSHKKRSSIKGLRRMARRPSNTNKNGSDALNKSLQVLKQNDVHDARAATSLWNEEDDDDNMGSSFLPQGGGGGRSVGNGEASSYDSDGTTVSPIMTVMPGEGAKLWDEFQHSINTSEEDVHNDHQDRESLSRQIRSSLNNQQQKISSSKFHKVCLTNDIITGNNNGKPQPPPTAEVPSLPSNELKGKSRRFLFVLVLKF